MTQNEINMAILAEIKKNAMGNNICWIIEDKEVCNKIYTIKVGASTYKIGCDMIFYALWRFEQLCGIRQKDKARFAYGVEKDEIISEKAMYYTGRKERTSDGLIVGEGDYKLRTRKTTMRKLSDNVAEDKNGRAFYYFGGLWYHINNHNGRTVATRTAENENCMYELLSRFDFSQDGEFVQIYRALFDAMKAARGNDAAGQRKSENEAKNAVICDRTGESAGNKGNLPKTQIASATGYNLLPFYLRQKVFPTEPFYAGRKISRFKPRYLIGYTNYHLTKESALERKRNGNTSVYRTLIRCET